MTAHKHAALIAGALYDFLGYLTSRNEILVLAGNAPASPAIDALKAWSELRGLPLNEALVDSWCEYIAKAPRTITIAGIEVPMPMMTAPAQGTMYWYISLYFKNDVVFDHWDDSVADKDRLDISVIHSTKEAA